MSMQGKICLITGANSGVGKATALGLAQQGATVVLACRNRAKGEAVQQEIQEQTGNQNVDLLLVDLSAQESIHRLAQEVKQRYQQLHVLINNAGLFDIKRTETVDGIEETLAVNYLAPFLLTTLLLDLLKASTPARIINVSSNSQTNAKLHMDDLQSQHHHILSAYGQSKLALVMFTYQLAERLQGTGVTVNCLHPGFVATGIGQQKVGPLERAIVRIIFSVGISPEKGALTSLYLATSPEVEQVSGRYFAKGVPIRTNPLSYDKGLQQALWNESEKLLHLNTSVA